MAVAAAAPADELELVNGTKFRGLVVEKADLFVRFEVHMPGAKLIVRYPTREVASVKIDGKAPVFDKPKPPVAPPAQPAPPTPPIPPAPRPPAQPSKPVSDSRSVSEIDALIEKTSQTPPPWWDSVPLNYPRTLDLTGKYQSTKWEPQKKLGAYMFSVITPNPGRWRSAIKLWHHVLSVRKNDPTGLAQAMNQLAMAYRRYEKDYARSAFWYRKAMAAGHRPYGIDVVGLAECYRHLGSAAMAQAHMKRYGLDRSPYGEAIRLWAEMGQVDLAIRLAGAMIRQGYAGQGYMYLGNVYRLVGRNAEALAAYEKALANAKSDRNAKRLTQRAQSSIEAIKLFDALDLTQIRDGTYTGETISFRGPLQVQVVVRGGRIESVKVTRHKDDIYYTSITDIPQRIVKAQGFKGIDAITGATVTCSAIVNAAAKALYSGMK